MIVGVPKEVKDRENRVGMTPAGVAEIVARGATVFVEQSAGSGSGFADAEYVKAGGRIVPTAADAWGAEMVVKVKEPTHEEYGFLRPGLVLFTYLHLAADEPLTRALLDSRTTGIAYETVQLASNFLPLLNPMSEVAGRMSIQVGAHYLEKTYNGRGMLLGGVPGVAPAKVAIVGGGTVGTNAAQVALGMGAHVTVLEKSIERMRYLSEVFTGHLTTLYSTAHAVAESVAEADVVIGAVLIPGARAPRLVTEPMVRAMRAGSVVIDVAIDQGGCIETARPTSHSNPVYEIDGVTHYCVTNMPGAVPRTSTQGLTNATLPYVVALVTQGMERAIGRDAALAKGVNTYDGRCTEAPVASAFTIPYTPLRDLLGVASA
ncbi:MAG: alanine dehydrogenase [Chloroflexota bacterium]|nr:alanine dehydrogenase [Chloroflexota bacterium]